MNISKILINNTVYDIKTGCPYDYNVYQQWSRSVIILYIVAIFIIIIIYIIMDLRVRKAQQQYTDLLKGFDSK